MKVDFNAQFPYVNKLIGIPRALSGGAEKSGEFGRLLADISPDKALPVEIVPEVPPPAPAQVEPPQVDSGPMARFDFPKPSLKSPEFERISPEATASETVTPEPLGVKTPAVLSIRRIPDPDDMARMRRADREKIVEKLVSDHGVEQGIDPALSMALVSVESAFNPTAVSSDGHYSKGLFQLLDRTGKLMLEDAGLNRPYDPFDPALNSQLGVRYLRRLHDMFSTENELSNGVRTVAAANSASLEKLAVAAYNAGEGRVAWAQQRAIANGANASVYDAVERYLPASTQEYVRKVTAARERFGRETGGSIG